METKRNKIYVGQLENSRMYESTYYLGKESLITTHLCGICLQYLRMSILKYNLVKKKKQQIYSL
jgi:hypothetical protein